MLTWVYRIYFAPLIDAVTAYEENFLQKPYSNAIAAAFSSILLGLVRISGLESGTG